MSAARTGRCRCLAGRRHSVDGLDGVGDELGDSQDGGVDEIGVGGTRRGASRSELISGPQPRDPDRGWNDRKLKAAAA
jgi:hypothetical protein